MHPRGCQRDQSCRRDPRHERIFAQRHRSGLANARPALLRCDNPVSPVDGALAVDAAATHGWKFATPWSLFAFGFTHYQTLATTVDVYLDELALDGSMVACP
jgi:hypothetical protein